MKVHEENKKYFAVLTDALNKLADLLRGDKELYAKIVSVRLKLGSEFANHEKIAQKKLLN